MPGCFRPRPLQHQSRLERILLALEVPDCGCPLRVRWVEVPAGHVTDLRGRPAAVRAKLPVFGWQARGAPPDGLFRAGDRVEVRPAPRAPHLARRVVLCRRASGVVEQARGRSLLVAAGGRRRCWALDGRTQVRVFDRPCPHAAAREHSLPVERWAELLAAHDAAGYREPPRDPVPWSGGGADREGELLYREGREALLAERARLGFALFHEDDFHQGDVEGVALQGGKGRRQLDLFFEQTEDEDDLEEEHLAALADLHAWAVANRMKAVRR